jgi:hypothetical protein
MAIDPRFLEHLEFRCIGPTRGGRVVAVTGDPNNPAVFYFGACAGGVWKSDDAGQYWECISDGYFKTGAVGAIAIAPSDSNVLYVGTGESTIRIDVSHGDGVYKSTDAGKSWTNVGLADSRHIGKIRVHPTNPDLVYVAALGHASWNSKERGVFRSSDGGKTWEHVLFVDAGAGAVDISLDPNNPRVLFATIWQARRSFWSIDSGGPHSGLWRSIDGGDTWEEISSNKGLPSGTVGKMGVILSPARSGRVWAIIESEGRSRGLFRSDDNGDTWTRTSGSTELCWRPWYYMHVVAHPTDPDTVWVMNQKAWKSTNGGITFERFPFPHGDTHDLWVDPGNPDRMIGADDGGAFVSHNAGWSWSSIYNQMTAQFYHLAVDNEIPYNVYGTQQDNSSIRVPSRTGNGAITWGDCHPTGTGESGYIAPHPDDANIVYVGAIGSSPGGGDSLQRYDHRTGQTQLITVWPEESWGAKAARYRFQWTYPIVFDPHDSGRLFVAGNQVMLSEDEGHSWRSFSPDLTAADPDTLEPSGKPLTHDAAGAETYATIFSFAGCPIEKGTFWAGSDDGLVHITRDDGENWTNVTPAELLKFSQVTMIETSPFQAGTVYMTVARHKMGDYIPYVMKTDDYGATWTLITAGLPPRDFCRVIRVDPDQEGMLYLGMEQGLFVSFDDGGTWQSLQGSLPISPVYDLAARHGDLVVATHGRSFWVLDDRTQIQQLNEAPTDQVQLFAPADTIRAPLPIFADLFSSPGGKSYHVSLGQNATFYETKNDHGRTSRKILDAGTDPARGVAIRYYLPEQPTGEVRLSIRKATGQSVNEFTSQIPAEEKDRDGLYVPNDPGMNLFQWPMTYRSGIKMTGATEMNKPAPGPLAAPGAYVVELTVGDQTLEQEFSLLADPRVDMTDQEFLAQEASMLDIQAKIVEATQAVNQIRSLKGQISGWIERTADHGAAAELSETGQGALSALKLIEQELVQVDFLSSGDSLNFPDQLIEKLGMLPSVVGGSDRPPTSQSGEVFTKLSGEVDVQLAALGHHLEHEIDAFSGLLEKHGMSMIMP